MVSEISVVKSFCILISYMYMNYSGFIMHIFKKMRFANGQCFVKKVSVNSSKINQYMVTSISNLTDVSNSLDSSANYFWTSNSTGHVKITVFSCSN